MKNYKNSDYAINKYREGIVYKFADGIIEVTKEDYIRENPDKTEEDFVELKRLSDEIYHQQIIQEHRTSYLDVDFEGLQNKDIPITPSAEESIIQEEEERKALNAAKSLLNSGKLTTVQERRFYLYFFQGLSTRQIARLERVHQRAIWDSLMWAGKKFKKFFVG